MKDKNTRYVTIVTDGKGKFSYHSSWKSACEAYDWEYQKNRPKEKNGYRILKAPMEVTIDCLDLVEFIHRNNVSESSYLNDGLYEFDISGYSKGYQIFADYTERHEEADHHHGDRGVEEISPAHDYHELTDIISVFKHDEDGTEVKVDKWTEQQLLDFLTVED